MNETEAMLSNTHFKKLYLTHLPFSLHPSTFIFSSLLHITINPSNLTKEYLSDLIRSCSSHPKQLKQIHSVLLTTGLSVKNSLPTQLLTSFIELGDLSYALQLFEEMHKPRSFLWNALIKGYLKNDHHFEAASFYKRMHSTGVRPDAFTYPFVVKACAELLELWTGFAVHTHVVKYGLDFVPMVRTELMVMYVKFGEVGMAEFLFENMADKDLVAWNALIAVCAQTGHASKSVELFRRMEEAGVQPDSVTVVGALSACANLGCLEMGEKIYDLARENSIVNNIIVDNARLDMYVKCGSVDVAREFFDKMPTKNVISWSTMIVGYAINGKSEKALDLFHRMQGQHVHPNYVTFLGVLSACSHAGLVREGWKYFNHMVQSSDKNIKPRKEHYACMVDLLGRSGHLEEAFDFIRKMPIEPDPGIWGALLGACAIHNNVNLGQHVADILFALAPDIASYHVLLSNMYAAAGKWSSVEQVRKRIKRTSVKKVAAYSSVEFGGEIHVLYGGDKSHPQSAIIYQKLDELIKHLKSIGYVPKTSAVFHDVETEEKEASLIGHSEKLAVVLGLINVRLNSPIRVMKNLRICDDCHSFCKFTTRLTMREIIMRDKSRFHHFKDGVCSCKDFW